MRLLLIALFLIFSHTSFAGWQKIVGTVLIEVGPATSHGSCRVWIGNQVRFFHTWASLERELRQLSEIDDETIAEIRVLAEIQVLFNRLPAP